MKFYSCLFKEYERQQSKLEKMEKLSPPPAKLDAVSLKWNNKQLSFDVMLLLSY